MEYSPVAGSAATNLTSLMRMEESLLSPRVSLICLAKSCALEPPIEKARTRRGKSASVTLFGKRMADKPAAGSHLAEAPPGFSGSRRVACRRKFCCAHPERKHM